MNFVNVKIEKQHIDLANKYGNYQNIGGYSNLNKFDLSKTSRLAYQFTGIFGEISWHIYRRGNTDTLTKLLEHKFATLRPTRKGDDGYDDELTHNNLTRKVDIKTSHITDQSQIPKLNLVIPEREYHTNMIYVAAFTVGSSKEDRLNIDKVILAGWCINENVKERWRYDDKKFAVRVPNLKPLSILKRLF